MRHEWKGRELARVGAIALGVSLMAVAACGGGGTGGGPVVGGSGPTGGPGNGAMPHPPWTELSPAAVSVEGGWAESSGGQAQAGGSIHIVSAGPATFDPSAGPGPAPDVPAETGQALGADALGSDVHVSGSIRIDGDVTAGGNDAVRTITADGGDIFVVGKLRSADLGASRQGITLSAPGGNVYVVGGVDTSGAAGAGQSGGAITINAKQAVVTGALASAGGDGANAGGSAGAVAVTASAAIAVTGTVDAFGGNGHAAGTAGGAGGGVTLQAGGDVTLAATVRLRGGAATSTGGDAQGGNAATLTIDGAGALRLGGTVDGRGGFATATGAGGKIAGGTAGTIKIGESAAPASVGVAVPITLAGGKGGAVAGAGGAFALEAGGDIHVAAQLGVNGGSISNGGSGDGGTAGTVALEVKSDTGALTVAAAGEIDLDGGGSGGTGKGGGGGGLTLLTRDGDLSVAGRLYGRGGAARDPGGTGGQGAQFDLFSDNDHNGIGGNLTIEAGGVLDASGGSGTNGGSARNNGTAYPDVASFPDHIDEIAILLNSDGIHGTTRDGVLVNMGRVVAKGGTTGGSGGDVVFHGKAADGGPNPLEGDVETDGDGSGLPGQFRSE